MNGTVTKLKPKSIRKIEIVTLTPERATELLEHNSLNRPLVDQHVQRIARQIIEDKWEYNGDTIKIADGGDVLDGQHRLWAVIEAKKSVETGIAYGVPRSAFATIDTIRRHRSFADTLSLCGAGRYRQAMGSALAWLLRWQRQTMENYREPKSRIENSDIETAYASHPRMLEAVERATKLRTLANVSIMAFVYYAVANRNVELADRMMDTLENPAGVSVSDPFFRLRAYFTA